LADAEITRESTLETEGEVTTFIYLHDVVRLYFMICVFYIVRVYGLHLFTKRSKPDVTLRTYTRRPRVRMRKSIRYIDLLHSYRYKFVIVNHRKVVRKKLTKTREMWLPEDVKADNFDEKMRFIDPLTYYGIGFHEYMDQVDPLLMFHMISKQHMLLKSDIRQKERDRLCISACNSVDKLFPNLRNRGGIRRVYANLPDDRNIIDSNKGEHRGRQIFPIVIDTGASLSVSPVKEDFIGEIITNDDVTIKGLSHEIRVAGHGRVRWKLRDAFGKEDIVETDALYIPNGDVRLFSPQCWFQEHRRGSMLVTHDSTTITSPNDEQIKLTIPYFYENNLPIIFHDPMVKYNIEFGSFTSSHVRELMSEERKLFLSVADETNQNLTRAQKELLLWHWKFGHAGFQWVQQLLRNEITPKNPKATSCAPPMCAACALARLTRIGAGVSTEYKDPKKEMSLKANDLEPGRTVSMDQYQSTVCGRLPDTFGKEKEDDRFGGGTIFVDHASTKIYIKHQVSLKAGETIQAKRAFERDALQHGVKVQHYHADNGVFDTRNFLDEIQRCGQTIEFCGVGAHHQNGVAERAIRTVTEWARAMLLHAALHWPDRASLDLWPFAMNYAVYIWNTLPKRDLRISPQEIFTKTKCDSSHFLQRLHVWGCPAYVLDPKLQDDKKLPKWSPRSSRGQFLGLSTDHSSNIGLILNLRTGYISPQFHVVYDDLFQTVPNVVRNRNEEIEIPFDQRLWDELFRSQRERYIDSDVDSHEIPDLHPDWMEPDEAQRRQQQRDRRFEQEFGRPPGQIDNEINLPQLNPPNIVPQMHEEEDEEPVQQAPLQQEPIHELPPVQQQQAQPEPIAPR
jgi:hypothetical protein